MKKIVVLGGGTGKIPQNKGIIPLFFSLFIV